MRERERDRDREANECKVRARSCIRVRVRVVEMKEERNKKKIVRTESHQYIIRAIYALTIFIRQLGLSTAIERVSAGINTQTYKIANRNGESKMSYGCNVLSI